MNTSESGPDHPVTRRWIIGSLGRVVACAVALAFVPPLGAATGEIAYQSAYLLRISEKGIASNSQIVQVQSPIP